MERYNVVVGATSDFCAIVSMKISIKVKRKECYIGEKRVECSHHEIREEEDKKMRYRLMSRV